MTSRLAVHERLRALRRLMDAQNVDATIVPSADPHMSEYLPDCWQARRYFSGFTGSAGTLVVGKDFAHLWTDSRYWLQAKAELDTTPIALKKIKNQADYAADLLQAPNVRRVAVDGMAISAHEFERLQRLFGTSIDLELSDIAARAWQGRPPLPSAPVYCHDERFCDASSADKLAAVRQSLRQKNADVHLISALDDVAWITNLRGKDTPCNPIFLAHMLIDDRRAVLYVDGQKLSQESADRLAKAGIETKDYDAIVADVGALRGRLLIDDAKVAIGLIKHTSAALVVAPNPSTLLKAVKTPQTLAHIRQAMIQDGAALCAFFADLERRLEGGEAVDEADIADLLTLARQKQPHYVGPSFETIAGFGANAAVVHYRADKANCRRIAGDGLLLIDSGAQYQNGTTDITRTLGVGQVSDAAKRDVTYVLKAHIALACAVFPSHTSGAAIDAIARAPLWIERLDYGHGTGHGVGYFLNVHEGPQSIAYRAAASPERNIVAGMLSSNEPGLYREGLWGVRIENLIAAVEVGDGEFGKFLGFETLTLCPIDTRVLLVDLLDQKEKDWLNAYHAKVRKALEDRVEGDAKAWLFCRTEAI